LRIAANQKIISPFFSFKICSFALLAGKILNIMKRLSKIDRMKNESAFVVLGVSILIGATLTPLYYLIAMFSGEMSWIIALCLIATVIAVSSLVVIAGRKLLSYDPATVSG